MESIFLSWKSGIVCFFNLVETVLLTRQIVKNQLLWRKRRESGVFLMIEVKDLTKKYGTFTAVDHIDIVAKPGRITVLLGPNGAGKSTTIKSITNLLKFQGEIKICGYDNTTLEAKRSFGYIPEAPMLYDLLTVEEHIRFIASAYRVRDGIEKAEQYLGLLEMKEQKKKIAKELSKGMKQKLSMILALLISPKALLVDEPMVGLDPISIEKTLHLLTQLKEDGCAILVSTHIIDIMNEVWDDAYIMNHGKIVSQVSRETMNGSLKELFFQCVGE